MDRERKLERPTRLLKISQKYYNTQLKPLSKNKIYQPYSEVEKECVQGQPNINNTHFSIVFTI